MAGARVATIAILAALQARERTGKGQIVDVSLLGSAVAMMTLPATRRLAGSDAADELTGAFAGYRIYRCRDGRHLAVGALEPKFWEALCRALGLDDHIGRQWDRGARGRETIAAFERAFAGRDRDEWVRALKDVEACVEPVLDPTEAFTTGPAAALLTQPPSGSQEPATPACPIRLRDTPATVRRAAPRLGEHTREVLREAGYSADQIEGMHQAGAVA